MSMACSTIRNTARDTAPTSSATCRTFHLWDNHRGLSLRPRMALRETARSFEIDRVVPTAADGPVPNAGDDPVPSNAESGSAGFWAFANAGARLAEIHVGYEAQPEYCLKDIENPDAPLNWRVEKMRLSKDKTQIEYNDFLTLDGIPPKAFDYQLGNRSALEWIIDQYCVKTDKRSGSGIINDPNREADPKYIYKLIGKVIAVSLETVAIVEGLPELEGVGNKNNQSEAKRTEK